jgi:hypothetical protein
MDLKHDDVIEAQYLGNTWYKVVDRVDDGWVYGSYGSTIQEALDDWVKGNGEYIKKTELSCVTKVVGTLIGTLRPRPIAELPAPFNIEIVEV